jgi:hypothetical protein
MMFGRTMFGQATIGQRLVKKTKMMFGQPMIG